MRIYLTILVTFFALSAHSTDDSHVQKMIDEAPEYHAGVKAIAEAKKIKLDLSTNFAATTSFESYRRIFADTNVSKVVDAYEENSWSLLEVENIFDYSSIDFFAIKMVYGFSIPGREPSTKIMLIGLDSTNTADIDDPGEIVFGPQFDNVGQLRAAMNDNMASVCKKAVIDNMDSRASSRAVQKFKDTYDYLAEYASLRCNRFEDPIWNRGFEDCSDILFGVEELAGLAQNSRSTEDFATSAIERSNRPSTYKNHNDLEWQLTVLPLRDQPDFKSNTKALCERAGISVK